MDSKKTFHGLNDNQVEESRRLHGENILTPPKKTSLWKLFLEKFDDPIIKILLVAWFLSMIIAGVHCWGPEAKGFTAFLEPIGIFFAIILASGVGFFFEVKANKAFDVLNTVNDDIEVKVIRNGNICQITRKDVVVGDIVATSGVIAGAVKGEIDINGPIVIDSTAIIKGNIKAKSVQINNGAVIEGFCSLSYSAVDVDNIFE